MSDDMRNATQGALALYLNEVQPVDGRVQINISLNELNVLRGLAAAPAVDQARLINAIDSPTVEALARVWTMRSDKSCSEQIVEILAPLLCRPATPAVGGEALKDSVRGAIARGWCSRANEHKEFDADLASSIFAEVWAEIAAAQPASPLRGRGWQQMSTAPKDAEIIGQDPDGRIFNLRWEPDDCGENWYDVHGDQLAYPVRWMPMPSSVSPPEQPAAATTNGDRT